MNKLLSLALTGAAVLFLSHAALAVTGDDTAPGEACSNEDATRMTANPSGSGGYMLTCESGQWVARLSGATPVANENYATKEYVDAAGGGTVYYCKPTTTTYNGNLGGLSGADAKCAAEFGSDYYMAKGYVAYSSNITMVVISPGHSTVDTLPYAWIDETGYNCSDWTSSNSSDSGSTFNEVWDIFSTGSSAGSSFNVLASDAGTTDNACDGSRYIMCCNIPD